MKVILLESVDSTNAHAKILLASEQLPFWILAERQSKGRGRYQRKWISNSGNLFCSGVYPIVHDLTHASNLSFVAAIAVAETLAEFVSPELIKIKWPNDILLNGKKVSGILLETFSHKNNNFVIIGIGINLLHHPKDSLYPATNLLEHANNNSLDQSPSIILDVLIDKFEALNETYTTKGFAPIRERWHRLCYNIPGEVDVNLLTEKFSGMATGIDLNGSLLVRLSNGTMRNISAGDVFFGSDNV